MPGSRTVKELIRHSVAKAGLAGLHVRVRKAMGENVDHLLEQSLTNRFAAIYRNRVWLNGRLAGALSGLGSEIANTCQVRQHLPELLKSLGSKTLLDIGCGDFNWMKEIEIAGDYIGVDIVREVIEANIDRYGKVGRSFRVLDGTCDPLPPSDTVLCREVLFHLSFKDMWNLFGNVRQSKAKVFVATTDNAVRVNADILSGDFRFLNLRRGPFYFPPPTLSILDTAVAPDRVLAAWPVEQLPLCR